MDRILHPSTNCNSWLKKNFENIGEELPECPNCSSLHSFSYKRLDYVYKWDITIPENWQHGEWDDIHLFQVHVPFPVVKCEKCCEYYRVDTCFIMKGTTLTITALVFCAYAHECRTSSLVWRKIIDRFCKGLERLSHSTVFNAVKKFADLIAEHDLYKKLIFNVPNLADFESDEENQPTLKSRYEHTRKREKHVLSILSLLVVMLENEGSFASTFSRYMEVLQYLLKPHKFSLPIIYRDTS